MTRYAAVVGAFLLIIMQGGWNVANAAGDPAATVQSQEDVKPPAPGLAPPDPTEPDPSLPTDNETPPADEVNVGEIPDVKMVDLTLDAAKRAVDAYILLKDKYKDAALENYETLQEFVDKDPQGKAFDADVKAAGFANVDIWNQTVTTVSAAYANIMNDQTADIKSQIEEAQKDTAMAQDMRDKIVASLNALIPTQDNQKVVQQLIDDPTYTEKLKQLETEGE